MQRHKTQVEAKNIAEAATSFDSKIQNSNKNKIKQKTLEVLFLARFQNIQREVQNTKSLDFTTELKKIEKNSDNNFYDILEFSSNKNNIDFKIQTQRYIQLTKIIYSDKINKKFFEQITTATKSKKNLYRILNFAESLFRA